MGIKALLVTYCYIYHLGRIPYLLAVGFHGPIYAAGATAHSLPLLIEDAIKVGVTRDWDLMHAILIVCKSCLWLCLVSSFFH